MYNFPADKLTLYIAKKGGDWLKADDPDVLRLKEGVVTSAVRDIMKSGMDASYRVRNTAFGFPDEDAAEDGDIHVLVELPKGVMALPRDSQLVVGNVAIAITPRMRLNPPALGAFWKALRNDRTEVEAGVLVELPRGAYLLGDPTLGSRFYIRSCYPELMGIVDLDWLVKAGGQLDAGDDQVSHLLMHFRVSKTFDSEYFVFASRYVRQEVYKRLYEKDKRKLLEFIAVSDGVGALAGLRGHLLEGHEHSVPPRGGTFQVRPLVDNDEAFDDDLSKDE